MPKDWMFAEPLGLYVIADVEGKTVKSVEMTKKKPAFKAQGTAFIKAVERYFATGKDAFSPYSPDYTGMTPFRKKVMQELQEGSCRRYRNLRRARVNLRQPGRRPRRGQRHGHEPGAIVRPLPPGRRHERPGRFQRRP